MRIVITTIIEVIQKKEKNHSGCLVREGTEGRAKAGVGNELGDWRSVASTICFWHVPGSSNIPEYSSPRELVE